jgi:DNA-binding transcriptional MerR regulator
METIILFGSSVGTLVCLSAHASGVYSLQGVAELTGVHPELLGYYCRRGLIEGVSHDPARGWIFAPTALAEVRRIEHYRRHLGVQRRALPLLCELRREGARQRIPLHFLEVS